MLRSLLLPIQRRLRSRPRNRRPRIQERHSLDPRRLALAQLFPGVATQLVNADAASIPTNAFQSFEEDRIP